MQKQKKIISLVLLVMVAIAFTACSGSQQETATAIASNPTIKPIPSEAVTAAPTVENPLPTATIQVENPSPQASSQLNIIETNSFMDAEKYWYFHGLVQNDLDQTVYDVQVEVTLLDTTGTEVYSYTTYTMLSYLEPGEISPFSDFSTEPFPEGKTMEAAVVGYQAAKEIQRAGLDFKGITIWADEYNDIYLAGEAFNRNNEPIQINDIAGTMVDDSGNLVSASSAYPFLTYIEPGGSSPFVMLFDAPLGEAGSLVDYKLYSDALTINPTSTYDITLSKNHKKYQDANGDVHLVGSVTNNTDTPLNIYLVAGLFDQRGNCVDANVVYLPMAVNPGETFPYDFNVWGPVDYVEKAYEDAVDFRVYVDWLSTFETDPVYKISSKDDLNAFDGLVGHFTGSVVNTSGQDLTTELVNVSLYEKASGELIATNLNFVAEALSPDATAAYEVYLYPPNDIDPAETNIVITVLGQ